MSLRLFSSYLIQVRNWTVSTSPSDFTGFGPVDFLTPASTMNCVNLRSDPEFKLIFTDAVLDFESITQHPDNEIKNII